MKKASSDFDVPLVSAEDDVSPTPTRVSASRFAKKKVQENADPERIPVLADRAASLPVAPLASHTQARLVEVKPRRRDYNQLAEMEEVRPVQSSVPQLYQNANGDLAVPRQGRDHHHVHGFNGRDPDEYANAFNTFARFMPEFPYRGLTVPWKALLGLALFLALLASLYNAQFAGTFGSFLSDALALTWYLSIMAFSANVPINFNSIKLSIDKVSSDLFDRWKRDRLPLPDDSDIKRSVYIKGGIAAVGAFPPILFSIEKPLFGVPQLDNWGVKVPLILTQLVVVGAQNLRGLTKDDDMMKQEAVYYHREILLRKIAHCLGEDCTPQLNADIPLMAKGKFYAPPTSKVKGFVGKVVGNSYFAFVGIHAAATGFSVYRNLKNSFSGWFVSQPLNITQANSTLTLAPIVPVGSLWYDGLMVFSGGISIVSGVLRWLLLGKAAKGFVDSMFEMTNRPLFKLGDVEVVDSVFPANSRLRKIMPFLSVGVSITVGVSSLGSASQISHANFFNNSAAAGLLLASFIIGGGAAGPINTLDFKGLLDKLSGYVYIFVKSKQTGYDASARFGASKKEFLLKLMRIFTAMSIGDFAKKYLVTFNSPLEEINTDFLRMGITEQQRDACVYMRQEGLCGVGYARNVDLKHLHDLFDELTTADNQTFLDWKRGELEAKAERSQFFKRPVLVSQESAVDDSPSPSVRKTRSRLDVEPDESSSLTKFESSSRHSIN